MHIKNAAGSFVDPSLESVTAAAASAKLGKDTDFRVSITNAPGAGSYPISSFTWLLVKKDNKDAAKAKLMKATTIELKSSHVPMVSQPKKVAEFIVGAAHQL